VRHCATLSLVGVTYKANGVHLNSFASTPLYRTYGRGVRSYETLLQAMLRENVHGMGLVVKVHALATARWPSSASSHPIRANVGVFGAKNPASWIINRRVQTRQTMYSVELYLPLFYLSLRLQNRQHMATK